MLLRGGSRSQKFLAGLNIHCLSGVVMALENTPQEDVQMICKTFLLDCGGDLPLNKIGFLA